MTDISTEEILRALRFQPAGMTTAELAARLGARFDTISGRLSKLAAYGKINREIERSTTHASGRQRWSRWSMRSDQC